jgi:hypothetical protein
VVQFGPVGIKGREPGPTARGRTDERGRYTMRLDYPARAGAVVGMTRVYITKRKNEAATEGAPDAGGPPPEELLPARYHEDTILTLDVPAAGTDRANFDLTSP